MIPCGSAFLFPHSKTNTYYFTRSHAIRQLIYPTQLSDQAQI